MVWKVFEGVAMNMAAMTRYSLVVLLFASAVTVGTAGAAGETGAASSDFRLSATIPLPAVRGRLDHMDADLDRHRLYLAALAADEIDPATMRVVASIALAGHSEAFELAASGPQIFVNVPGAHQVAVIDRQTRRTVAVWKIEAAAQNYAMAFDEADHRSFVATHAPAALLVLDSATGKQVAMIDLCRGADDLFYDRERRRVYAVCGEGVVDAVRQSDADHYALAERLPTVPGARTGLFVPEWATLFVAAPARGATPARTRAYRIR